MRSKTSSFNLTLFGKNLTRFWPIWAVYALAWALQLPLPLLSLYMDQVRYGRETTALQRIADTTILTCTSEFGVILALSFGILTAMAVFSYLYSPRSAGLMHTLPIRREGLFFTSWLSGYCFMLLPNLFIAALTLAAEAMAGVLNGYNVLLWLLIQSGLCFFFFSFATFCAMFTGHVLALPAFYGILNFLAAGLVLLLHELVSCFTFGFVESGRLNSLALWLTPVAQFSDKLYFRTAVIDEAAGVTERLFTGLQYVLLYDLVALALLAWALALYRRRHVETAGDVIAVSWAKPLFKYGFAFCLALTGGLFLQSILQSLSIPLTLELLLCGVVGCFVAEMLMQKSFRVFRLAWKSAVALSLVLVVLVAGLSNNLFGLEDWVPAQENVSSVVLSFHGDFPPYDSGSFPRFALTDSDTIAAVTRLHRSIVDQRDRLQTEMSSSDSGDTRHFYWLRLEYTLSDGSQATRQYNFSLSPTSPLPEDSLQEQLLALVNHPTLLSMSYLPYEAHNGQAVSGSLDVYNLTTRSYEQVFFSAAQAQVLAQAVREDLANRRVGIHYLANADPDRQANCSYSDLTLSWFYQDTDTGATHTLSTTITPQFTASSLMKALEEVGALDDTHILLSYAQWLQDSAQSTQDSSDQQVTFYGADPVPAAYATEVLSPSLP